MADPASIAAIGALAAVGGTAVAGGTLIATSAGVMHTIRKDHRERREALSMLNERGHIGASSSLSRPARDTVAPTLSWAKGGAEQVVFSPDGRLVAVGHRDSDWSCGTVTFNPTATGYAGHVSAGQGRVISTHSSTHFSGSSHQRRQHQEITPPNTQRPGFGGGAQVPVYGRRSIMPPRQSRFDAQDFVGDGYANFDSRGGNPPPYEAAEKPSKGFWKR